MALFQETLADLGRFPLPLRFPIWPGKEELAKASKQTKNPNQTTV